MSSENPTGEPDNQQGRLDAYLSGFADGEGTFSVGATRRLDSRIGSSTDRTMVLVVRERQDLLDAVNPFFRRNPLLSEKRKSFDLFEGIVRRWPPDDTPPGKAS